MASVHTNQCVELQPQPQRMETASAQPQQQALQSNYQPLSQSSNLKLGFEHLISLFTRINYHNILESLNEIKQKECLLLKCEILTKTLGKILNRSIEESKRVCYQKINGVSGLRLQTYSHFDFKVKQSLETSLGMESVAWSLEIQKPKVLCENCRKEIQIRSTLSNPSVIEVAPGPVSIVLKDPEVLEPGVFSSQEHTPSKIMNLLPNELLGEVQDTPFINIQIPLFLEVSCKLIESSQPSPPPIIELKIQSQPKLKLPPPLLSLQQVQSEQQSILSPNTPKEINFEIKTLQTPSSRHQISIPQFQTIPNTSLKIPTLDIQKSFIYNLAIQESKHGFLSPKYQKPYPQLPPQRIVSEQMLESQILPVNYDNRDLFIRSIELNRTYGGNRTYSLPRQNYYTHQRFTDSQIKRHLFENKRVTTVEGHKVQHRREVQERVGEARSHHRPTFFETAYYF